MISTASSPPVMTSKKKRSTGRSYDPKKSCAAPIALPISMLIFRQDKDMRHVFGQVREKVWFVDFLCGWPSGLQCPVQISSAWLSHAVTGRSPGRRYERHIHQYVTLFGIFLRVV